MAQAGVPSRASWLLLALQYSSRGLTPVQIQKALFLLGQRRKKAVGAGFYRFEPYDYGPFSRAIYEDADGLAAAGTIVVDESRGRSLRRYQLTSSGRKQVTVLEKMVAPPGREYLRAVVAWVESLSFHELVRAVYEGYPEMRVNSVFRDIS